MWNFKTVFGGVILLNLVFTICAAPSDELNNFIEEEEEVDGSIENLETQLEDYSEKQQRNLPKFDIRYNSLPDNCANNSLPKNCYEATLCTKRSGVYELANNDVKPYYVECAVNSYGSDWQVIQRRQDGHVNFFRGWADYVHGFGNVGGEFWIGLENLYNLTNFHGRQELLIEMEDFYYNTAYAKYDHFVVGDSWTRYTLQRLGVYTGRAGDCLKYHLGMKFSTFDYDNDTWKKGNCALKYTGAWWHNSCRTSDLNGMYKGQKKSDGVYWKKFGKGYSLKHVNMMIRRRQVQ